ncbi:MAG: hypothetical protein AAF553_06870 [Pseudomonadota bacterium]
MRETVLGVFLGLALAGVGVFWWAGQAQVEELAPPPPEPTPDAPSPEELPFADVVDLEGPEPPEASELTREERRFFRYDRDRDRVITRNEMLSTRSDGFRKLDVDGNNLLTFEEWAVTTVERFEGADANGDDKLTPVEFRTTAPRARATPSKPKCAC